MSLKNLEFTANTKQKQAPAGLSLNSGDGGS